MFLGYVCLFSYKKQYLLHVQRKKYIKKLYDTTVYRYYNIYRLKTYVWIVWGKKCKIIMFSDFGSSCDKLSASGLRIYLCTWTQGMQFVYRTAWDPPNITKTIFFTYFNCGIQTLPLVSSCRLFRVPSRLRCRHVTRLASCTFHSFIHSPCCAADRCMWVGHTGRHVLRSHHHLGLTKSLCYDTSKSRVSVF